MKAVIIADIHDNLARAGECLAYAGRIGASGLFVCGDIAKDGTVDFLAKGFKNEIRLVRGNMCLFDEKKILGYDNIRYYGHLARFNYGGWRVGLCHEPDRIAAVKALGVCDYIFYGHTHRPWISASGATTLANPGTLNGDYGAGTFAVWDLAARRLELVSLTPKP